MKILLAIFLMQFPSSVSGVISGPIRTIHVENPFDKACYARFYFGGGTEVAIVVAAPAHSKTQWPAVDPGKDKREDLAMKPHKSGYFYYHADCEVHVNLPWTEDTKEKL